MKKTVAIFILTFMMLGILVGCIPEIDPGAEGGSNNGGENTEGGSTENGGSNGGENCGSTENGGDKNEENDPTNPENPGTDPENPGTDPENPGTNPENPGTDPENPGTDPENPGTDPENPGTDPENPEVKPEVGTDVGDLFGDVILETLDGGSINTADSRGKIIILNIWATWCPPCRAELPDFNRIATDYKDDAIIIAAHTTSEKHSAPSYVQTNFPDTDIIFAYDTARNDAFLAAGGINSIPQTVIIDQNGVIICVHTGMMSYTSLAQIIEENS